MYFQITLEDKSTKMGSPRNNSIYLVVYYVKVIKIRRLVHFTIFSYEGWRYLIQGILVGLINVSSGVTIKSAQVKQWSNEPLFKQVRRCRAPTQLAQFRDVN